MKRKDNQSGQDILNSSMQRKREGERSYQLKTVFNINNLEGHANILRRDDTR